MERLNGVSLAEYLSRQHHLSAVEASRLLAPAVDAVAMAHRRGLVHATLSPSTLHVVSVPSPDGKSTLLTLKVVGLGMSQLFAPDTAENPFLAPERSGENPKPADARSDLFSLGALYYHMITGDNPAYFQLKDEQPDISGLRDIKPVLRNVEDVIWKTINTWDMRYGRAEEMAKALEQIASGASSSGVTGPVAVTATAPPPDAVMPALSRRPATAKKKPSPALIAGIAAGLVVAVVAILLVTGGGSEDPESKPRDAADVAKAQQEERLREKDAARMEQVTNALLAADKLRGNGDLEGALAKVEAALALDPENNSGKVVKMNLEGDIQVKKMRDQDEARYREHLKKAQDLARERKWKEAIGAYDAALNCKDSPEARAGKEAALAAIEAEARLAEKRQQVATQMKAGEQWMRDGYGEEAKGAFQRVLDLARETPDLCTPEEQERIKSMIAQCGEDLGFNVVLNRVDALVKQNKWVEAQQDIESAYTMKPQDPRVLKLKADYSLHVPADLPPGLQFNRVNEKGFKEYRILQDDSVMVFIPGGWTVMGSSDGEPDEKPTRRAYCDAFLMDKTEVTWAQFLRFCKATGHQAPGAPAGWQILDNHPVVHVNFASAAAYCAWAGKRLPTEAEWERAARGNDSRKWPWGNEWDAALSNAKNQIKLTTPVGQYPNGASPWGLLDMAGNVREWCSDWYQDNVYASGEARNPKGPAKGTLRVQRGGSWFNFPESCRCSSRAKEDPGIRSPEVGFRGVRTLKP